MGLLQIQQRTYDEIQLKWGPSEPNPTKQPNWMGLPIPGDPVDMATWCTTPASWTQPTLVVASAIFHLSSYFLVEFVGLLVFEQLFLS